MMRMKYVSPEVYVADESVVAISRDEIGFLEEKVKLSARKRTRLCAHKDSEDSLHEMLVVYTGTTFVRPNLHPGKDESLHIMKGEADFVFFDDAGKMTEVVSLGDQESGKSFYVRVPADTYHSIVMKSGKLVIHECISGPFRKTNMAFAPWSPPEDDPRVTEFTAAMYAEAERIKARQQGGLLRMKQQSPEVFRSDEAVGKIGKRELDFLIGALTRTPKKRVRVCAHKSIDDRLQEMFITFSRGSYLRPSKHLRKNESVNVVHGRAQCVLFDERGEITDVIEVGDKSTGLPFYFRTPYETWHGWLIQSDVFTVHETTDGPFRLGDTIFAPWSPEPDDSAAVAAYQKELGAEVTRFREVRDKKLSCN